MAFFDLEWTAAAGTGTVVSWPVVRSVSVGPDHEKVPVFAPAEEDGHA